ncbi:MAG: CRISPR-associated CARF protein Csa3 [Desulfurococcaceae archaeon]|nr:CRISPR-associated CARF protein Csa3 [Desulfurococcaceae archaeon]
MSLYVFTLGFHADHVIKRLARARDVGGVIVVTATPVVKAVSDAFKNIVAFCDKASFPYPQLLDVDVSDGGSAALKVLEKLRGWSYIVADLGGGMRPLVTVTLIALLLAGKWAQVDLVVTGEREDAVELRVPLNTVYMLLTGIGQEKLRILEELSRSSMDVSEIAQVLGKSERTVRTYLGELKKFGLVVEDRGRYSTTSWGRLAIEYTK